MGRTLALAAIGALTGATLGLAACSDSHGRNADLDLGAADAGATDVGSDLGDEPEPDLGVATTFTFVMDTFTMPSSSKDFVYDIDGSGNKLNKLGDIVSTLNAVGGDDLQAAVNEALTGGTLLQLLAITSHDPKLQSDLAFSASIYVGALAEGADPGEAFTGAGRFDVIDDEVPPSDHLEGVLASGKGSTGHLPPGAVPIHFPLANVAPVPLTLYAAHVQFATEPRTPSGFNLGDALDPTQAQLHGGIADQDVHLKLIPTVAAEMQAYVEAYEAMYGTFPSSLSFIDSDGDETISAADLEDSYLVQNLLKPDLDLFDEHGDFAPNKDHVKDALSFGVGFTAVPASFSAP